MYPELPEEVLKLQNEACYKIPQEKLKKSGRNSDKWNITLLLFLYILQGIPVHLSLAIPIVLQKRRVSYTQQAGFSFITIPFVLKILWAPIVDSIYSSRFGRRKSWLIPSQYLIGLFMIIISMNIDNWIGDEAGNRKPNIFMLTLMFFLCNFMAATQDIAVDGWSLTMLQRQNVGYSATCNSVGFAVGTLLGQVLFIVLDSKDFCNRWLRQTPQPTGLISFSHYMCFWAILFLVITTFVLFFKKDNSLSIVEDKNEITMNMIESYSLYKDILKIKPVQTVCWILLTCRIGFGAISAVTPLKLIDSEVLSQDEVALMMVPFIPLQIVLPFLLGRHLTGPKSLSYFLGCIPFRLAVGALLALLVFTAHFIKSYGNFTFWYYGLLLLLSGLDNMAQFTMSMAGTAFFSRISDPRYGGTYLTMLNTLNNFGAKWPHSAALYLVDQLTLKNCSPECNSIKDQRCNCRIIVDGYYIEMAISIIVSTLWLIWTSKIVLKLQEFNDSVWLVQRKKNTAKNELL